MSTIHLTDAQRDTFAACGLVVIDGELSADGAERALQRMQQMNMPQGSDKFGRGYHQVTGHPLLAPEGWRILTEPCPCGDPEFDVGAIHESRWDDRLHHTVWFDPDCPDCVGGRRVVTLTATCPLHDDPEIWMCDHCMDGVVTLGRFTIPALLPVGTKNGLPWVDGVAVLRLTPPLPRPGQFIARPERVE